MCNSSGLCKYYNHRQHHPAQPNPISGNTFPCVGTTNTYSVTTVPAGHELCLDPFQSVDGIKYEQQFECNRRKRWRHDHCHGN